MTHTAPRLWVDEGVLSGQCPSCGAYLEQLADADEALARHGFDQAHPLTSGTPHPGGVPDGWCWPLSGPGALSQ